MNDIEIIELYFSRDERAIEETKLKYGRLLCSIANNILENPSESEECESDTYLKVWNSVPPTRPDNFTAYLSKIVRNIALNRLRSNKRHSPPEAKVIFDEIAELLPDAQGEMVENIGLRDALNSFLANMNPTGRQIFVKRYFYMCSIKDISRDTGVSVGSVKASLSRTRARLREYLTERGIAI